MDEGWVAQRERRGSPSVDLLFIVIKQILLIEEGK